jgi:hypothetical protein
MLNCERQKVGIGDLPRAEQAIALEKLFVQQAQ